MSSPSSRRSSRLKALASVPIVALTFSGMWAMGRLGLSRQAFGFMGRGMQSPRIKAQAFRDYQPTAQDVFVCTYSKSGTNWAMQIAYQIAHRAQGDFAHVHDVVAWPDAPLPGIVPLTDPLPLQSAPTGLRVIKTHLESPYVPYHPAAKYILILRDPKDVFVSSYFFSRGMLPGARMMPVADWLDLFLSDSFPYGSWPAHLASYWPWRTRPNVLLLTFEAMKADLAGAVQQIADLMGVALTGAEREQVITKSTFASMKAIDHKFTPKAPFPFNHLMGRPVMIRQGEQGSAAAVLTLAQQARIDEYMQAGLQAHQCDFPYREYFRVVESDLAQGLRS
jgi:hypothetical protein